MLSHQIIDLQRLLKKKQILKHPATRLLIHKGYWKKTISKLPRDKIINPLRLLKEKNLKYPATRFLIRTGYWKKISS